MAGINSYKLHLKLMNFSCTTWFGGTNIDLGNGVRKLSVISGGGDFSVMDEVVFCKYLGL